MDGQLNWRDVLPVISLILVAYILVSSLIAIIVFDRSQGFLHVLKIFSYTIFFMLFVTGMSTAGISKIIDPTLKWIGWANHIFTNLVLIYFSKGVLVFPEKEFESKVYTWIIDKQGSRSSILAKALIFLCVIFGPLLYVLVVVTTR